MRPPDERSGKDGLPAMFSVFHVGNGKHRTVVGTCQLSDMTDWTPAMTIGADAHIAGDGDTGFAVAEGCGNLIPGFGARDVVSSGSEYVFLFSNIFCDN